MSKLAISALVIVTAAVAVQGSLFGPFGPFGQPAAPPAFGPPGFVQPGFFPGFPGYQPVPVPAYQPSFGPPGYPAGFASVLSPLAARAFFPAAAVAPVAAPAPFRPKPSPVLERLLLRVLPEDLQEQLAQLLAAHDQGNAECDKKNTGFGPSVGEYRRCVVFNKIAAEQGATVLETEANARDAAEAQAAADQANAEKAAAEQAAAEQAEQAAAVEEAVAEEAAVVQEAEAVAEEAESTDDAEEQTVEVEETAEVVVEDVAVEEDSAVA
uniref:(northern house mosquito) hypothetical protein n=1 Tax=Culex pipiens TaxID=7175 RepID=A0A8D8HPC6_CULPI